MKYTLFSIMLLFLTSCGTLPQLYQSLEDVANDDAIDIMISREAISKETDVEIVITVKNSKL